MFGLQLLVPICEAIILLINNLLTFMGGYEEIKFFEVTSRPNVLPGRSSCDMLFITQLFG